MQTIKIIDLYNNIANGKSVPERIKYFDCELIYNRYFQDYQYISTSEHVTCEMLLENINGCNLNDEVEIIEDKPKKIDKIIIEYDNKDGICKLAYMNNCYELNPQEVIILDKIEELRNSVNYLLEKSDKSE